MDNNFTEEKQKEIKAAFDIYNRNNSGFVGLTNLREILLCLGIEKSVDEINNIMDEYGEYVEELANNSNKISTNDKYSNINDKKISYNNLYKMIQDMKSPADEEDDVMGCFQMMDMSTKGKINHEDLKYLMLLMGENFTDEELQEIISQLDVDNKGYFDYKDFVVGLMIKEDSIFETLEKNSSKNIMFNNENMNRELNMNYEDNENQITDDYNNTQN